MAAYNRAELIHVAIDSVLAQDFSDYELVIVDDGSTDKHLRSSLGTVIENSIYSERIK